LPLGVPLPLDLVLGTLDLLLLILDRRAHAGADGEHGDEHQQRDEPEQDPEVVLLERVLVHGFRAVWWCSVWGGPRPVPRPGEFVTWRRAGRSAAVPSRRT